MNGSALTCLTYSVLLLVKCGIFSEEEALEMSKRGYAAFRDFLKEHLDKIDEQNEY